MFSHSHAGVTSDIDLSISRFIKAATASIGARTFSFPAKKPFFNGLKQRWHQQCTMLLHISVPLAEICFNDGTEILAVFMSNILNRLDIRRHIMEIPVSDHTVISTNGNILDHLHLPQYPSACLTLDSVIDGASRKSQALQMSASVPSTILEIRSSYERLMRIISQPNSNSFRECSRCLSI